MFEGGVCGDHDYSEVDYLKSKIQKNLVNILNYLVLGQRIFVSIAFF